MVYVLWKLFTLFNLFVITFAFRFSLAPEYENIKICRSRNIDCSTLLEPDLQVRYYEKQYSQCTHIIGNLVLCNLRRFANESEPDLSFLNSIKEVSGYVYIGNNAVKSIPLTSLRIIRGRVPYEVPGVGNGSLIVSRNAINSSYGLEILDLRSLTVIQEHNIIAWDNPLLCHLAYTIDAAELFPDQLKQARSIVPREKLISHSGCIYDKIVCADACLGPDHQSFCWGPNENQCQIRSKCRDDPSKYCRLSPVEPQVQCDDACIGGCVEKTSNCWACQSKINGDTCTSSCPQKHIVNHFTSRQELNPDFKYELHDICVKNCPEPFLKMDTVCVIECDFRTTIPSKGNCEPCTPSPCAKHCTKEQIFGSDFPLMTSKAANKMRSCNYYSGPIYINKQSFRITSEGPLLNVSDLWNLRSLKEIVGYIYLDFIDAPETLRNLTFLENLYKVTSEFSGGVSLGLSLSIYNAAHLEFLGFKSLRYMDMDAYLESTPSLCYTSGLVKILPVKRRNVKAVLSCEKEGHVCHSECLPETGCWGPGPSMCSRCCAFEADGVCVAECSDAPGFYAGPGLLEAMAFGSNRSSQHRCRTLPLSREKIASLEVEGGNVLAAAIKPALRCARCHEECMETCSGPKADQCIGDCKHFKSGDECVWRCNKNQFADESSKMCLPCDSVCLSPPAQLGGSRLEDASACSGPGRHLGQGGCSFCYFVQKNSEATSGYLCLEDKCPVEHFGNATQLKNLELKKDHLSVENVLAANSALHECVPCHPECRVCTGPGAHASVCRQCRNWLYRSECVDTCPTDETYMPNSTDTMGISDRERQLLARKECLPCHQQCSGGCTSFGPEFCKNCRFAKIVLDVQKNKFICNSTCPPEKPHIMDSTNLCLDEDQYEEISGSRASRGRNQILLAVGLVLLFILIFSIALAIVCFNYKAKRNRLKEALRLTYTNIKAPDMKDPKATRQPNMARLEMINIDDLAFTDASNPIGRGAFGEVYRGKWKLPKRILSQFNLARFDYLEVAIKVLRSSNSTGATNAATSSTAVGDGNITMESDGCVASTGTQPGSEAVNRISARSDLQDMLSEAKVMASVQHRNCLPLIGVCLTRQMQCMVSVFVESGSLDRYLRHHKDELNSLTLLSWAEQIADGMAYLEDRGIIHRDLAARNVLVQSPDLVQITDFGLAKMLDSTEEDSVVVRAGRVPIRWLAIETLQDGIYSHKTDVWSYGVTLWEIFTFGKQPYDNVNTSDIKDHVMRGSRLSQPEICTLDTYMVMVRCWMEEYESRPTFMELMECFHKYCQTPGRYLYIEGDKYAITLPSAYTPSPVPWKSHQILPSSLRGVPDGIAGPPNGASFGFAEDQFFKDQHHQHYCGSQRSPICPDRTDEEDLMESQSLLPHRVGFGAAARPRRLFSNSNEFHPRYNAPPTLGSQSASIRGCSQDRSDHKPSPVISTSFDSRRTANPVVSFTGSLATPESQQRSTFTNYYNSSTFNPTETYGPMVRPPSPPLAEEERDDDIDQSVSDEVYLPTYDPPAKPVHAEVLGTRIQAAPALRSLTQEDYLEPRAKGASGRAFIGANAVGNPEYFGGDQDYLQPSVTPNNHHPAF